MNNKIITVIVAVTLVICAAGMAFALNLKSPEKKGLYQLDAKISIVDMGQTTATPGVALTIGQMYSDYYGELINDGLTIDDAKADSAFWNKYGAWSPMITENGDGTFKVTVTTALRGSEIIKYKVPVCDKVISIGTMYLDVIYFLICEANGAEPYSAESFTNENIKNYLNNTIAGGMQYSYYEEQNLEYMLKCVDKNNYYDLGANSVSTVDTEKLIGALQHANGDGGTGTIYFGSGTRITTKDIYDKNVDACKNSHSYYAFFSPSTIPDVYSAIECVGLIMGFGHDIIDKVIEDLQLGLYKVYYSVQELTAGKTPEKAYWESYAGKAVNATMAKVILQFLGFDTSLLDGAEHDTESLLKDKPVYIVFYNNDARTDSEKMRTNT